MNKLIKSFFSIGTMIAMLAIAPLASADFSINTASNDCDTVTIANHTTGEGHTSPCWNLSSVSAKPGQTINVAIYFHNNGNAAANNVTFKMSDPRNQTILANGSKQITGRILVNGTEVDSGTVAMNLSGSTPVKLELSNVYLYKNSTGQDSAVSNGSSIFSSNGLSYGTLNTGWNNQGVVKVSFKVVGMEPVCCNNDGEEPSVTTEDPSGLDSEEGDVQLNGSYDSNGSDTTTWFEYRRNNGSWTVTGTENQGTTEGDMDKDLTNLQSGDYDYRAVAENEHGRVEGNIVSFEIDRDGGCGNDCGGGGNDDIEVVTKSADDIEDDSAVLVGDLEEVGSGNVERWFEWDTNKSDVEDGDGSTLKLSGDTDNDGEFSKRLSGLDDNKTYYFRACAEDDDGNDDCGSVKSFKTDDGDNDNNDNDNDADLPSITTLNPVSIGSTVATVDGYYDANGCSVTTWYEYGRTSSLGSNTASVNRGNGSGGMAYSFTSLAPNTTYYYRAVGTNCEGTVRGAVKSFTTGGVTVVNPPVVITTGGGSGNRFIQLTIDNNRDIVRAGSEIAYDVEWGNITRTTLNDLVLEVNLPDQMIAVDTDRGDITRDGHAVIVEIDELGPLETGEITIMTAIRGNLRDGDPVVAQAVMAFENPNTKVAENAIAYDSDEFSALRSTLGASLFGLDFLPGSLAGWLLLLLIILAIIVLARHFMGQNQNKVTVNTNPVPVPQAPDAGTSTGNDYIVFRPNPLNK